MNYFRDKKTRKEPLFPKIVGIGCETLTYFVYFCTWYQNFNHYNHYAYENRQES